MVYNSLLDTKIPCAYILLNNKLRNSYNIILGIIKDIITENNTYKIKLYSVCTDFEEALSNSVKSIFEGIRHTGCLFHYIKNIRLNLNKIGLFKKNISNISQDLLKELGSIPFNVHNNNNIINEIFDKYSYKYSDKDDNIKLRILRVILLKHGINILLTGL